MTKQLRVKSALQNSVIKNSIFDETKKRNQDDKGKLLISRNTKSRKLKEFAVLQTSNNDETTPSEVCSSKFGLKKLQFLMRRIREIKTIV